MSSSTARKAAGRTAKGKKRSPHGGPRPDESRVEMVYRLRASLERPGYIKRVVSKAFGVDERTVASDIRRVDAEICADDEKLAANERKQFKAACLQQFRDCVREGDRKTALGYLVQLLRIGGHYAAEAVKMLNIDLGELQLLGDDELEAALRAEVAKHVALPPPSGAPL